MGPPLWELAPRAVTAEMRHVMQPVEGRKGQRSVYVSLLKREFPPSVKETLFPEADLPPHLPKTCWYGYDNGKLITKLMAGYFSHLDATCFSTMEHN